MSLRVLVADDAVLFRRVLSDALAALPEVEVVGTAANGKRTTVNGKRADCNGKRAAANGQRTSAGGLPVAIEMG